MINSNLAPILHRFQVMADYWSNFRLRESEVSHVIALAEGDPCQYYSYSDTDNDNDVTVTTTLTVTSILQ